MRQVPTYLVIGNGRLAAHMRHYLQHLLLPFSSWDRSQSLDILQQHLCNATHILVLIRDDAIESFIQTHLQKTSATIVHCSGALITPLAFSAHPLQTFTKRLFHFSDYTKIPFILEKNGPTFDDLLPGFPNPHYKIPRDKKPLYHALCVMANNFSTLLWQQLFESMEKEFDISHDHLKPFLQATFQNLLHDPSHALTGPLARQDKVTLSKNLQALKDHPFFNIFQAFTQLEKNPCPSNNSLSEN